MKKMIFKLNKEKNASSERERRWALVSEVESLKLPSGKELTLYDLVKFCYDLSETDLDILFKLMDGQQKTIEELSEQLNLSKATVSRSLTKLLGLGFITRTRIQSGQNVGRPKYAYKSSLEQVEARMRKDVEKCSEIVKEFITKVLSTQRLKLA